MRLLHGFTALQIRKKKTSSQFDPIFLFRICREFHGKITIDTPCKFVFSAGLESRWCPRPETCAYIPGCSTSKGETAYGGWCSGEGCAHLDQENCLLNSKSKSKCHWRYVKSDPETLCRGDLGRWQNPGCSFSNDPEACMWMPGCNWAGQNHFGGWCTGDKPHCAMETSVFACQDAQCHWQSSAQL